MSSHSPPSIAVDSRGFYPLEHSDFMRRNRSRKGREAKPPHHGFNRENNVLRMSNLRIWRQHRGVLVAFTSKTAKLKQRLPVIPDVYGPPNTGNNTANSCRLAIRSSTTQAERSATSPGRVYVSTGGVLPVSAVCQSKIQHGPCSARNASRDSRQGPFKCRLGLAGCANTGRNPTNIYRICARISMQDFLESRPRYQLFLNHGALPAAASMRSGAMFLWAARFHGECQAKRIRRRHGTHTRPTQVMFPITRDHGSCRVLCRVQCHGECRARRTRRRHGTHTRPTRVRFLGPSL